MLDFKLVQRGPARTFDYNSRHSQMLDAGTKLVRKNWINGTYLKVHVCMFGSIDHLIYLVIIHGEFKMYSYLFLYNA